MQRMNTHGHCMLKRAYEQRVKEVEHSSFTPVVLSATSGMSEVANHLGKLFCILSDDEL